MAKRRSEDKRKFARFRPSFAIDILTLDGSPLGGTYRFMDLSEGGAQFATSEFIKKGITLQIHIDSKGSNPLIVEGLVRWVNFKPFQGERYQVGVAFLSLTNEQREWIQAFKKYKK